jgi:hypothetical protein
VQAAGAGGAAPGGKLQVSFLRPAATAVTLNAGVTEEVITKALVEYGNSSPSRRAAVESALLGLVPPSEQGTLRWAVECWHAPPASEYAAATMDGKLACVLATNGMASAVMAMVRPVAVHVDVSGPTKHATITLRPFAGPRDDLWIINEGKKEFMSARHHAPGARIARVRISSAYRPPRAASCCVFSEAKVSPEWTAVLDIEYYE